MTISDVIYKLSEIANSVYSVNLSERLNLIDSHVERIDIGNNKVTVYFKPDKLDSNKVA